MMFVCGFFRDCDATWPQMQQGLFGVFWQKDEKLREIKLLFTAHRETAVLRWYNTLDGGWNQTEVLRK
jgi:hypothetical protein